MTSGGNGVLPIVLKIKSLQGGSVDKYMSGDYPGIHVYKQTVLC